MNIVMAMILLIVGLLVIGRIDGIVLLCAYAGYVVYLLFV